MPQCLFGENLNAKLADFAGSSIDASPLLVAVTPSHEYPGNPLSVQGDLFAFGSMLYEIMTGHAPYDNLAEREINSRYMNGVFPETGSLQGVGYIIQKCWRSRYKECEGIISDLGGIYLLSAFKVLTDYQSNAVQGICIVIRRD